LSTKIRFAATQVTSIENGTITQKDLDEALGNSHATPEVLCAHPTLPSSSGIIFPFAELHDAFG
jgi:hypothetical protein